MPDNIDKEKGGFEDVMKIIAPSGVQVLPSYLKIGDKLAKSFFFFSYPRYLSTGWAEQLINLPNLFQIGGTATSQTANTGVVNATNLNTLTAGAASNADALHTHAAAPGTSVVITGVVAAATTLNVGDLVVFGNDTGSVPRVFPSDADSATVTLRDALGVAISGTLTAGGTANIQLAGEVPIAAARWQVEPVAADVGKRVYVHTVAGQWTLTAPTAAGTKALRTGWVSSAAASGSVKVVIGIGEGFTN